MTREEWVERYRRAWETADANEIVDLFTPDASYRSSVFREPYLGTQAIRQYWQRGAGSQRDVRVRMGRPVISAERVAVEWWATMADPDEGEITLPGCLLLRFAPDGRCHDLWEYWQVQPGKQNPPAGWGIWLWRLQVAPLGRLKVAPPRIGHSRWRLELAPPRGDGELPSLSAAFLGCCLIAGDEAQVKVERPQRSEDVRP